MRNAMVVPAEGEPYGLLLPDDGNSSLAVYQQIVGGYIELVPNPHGVTVYCNEEGKIMEPPLPLNLRATALFGDWLQPWDIIAGNVIVVGPPDREGYDTRLDDVEGWIMRAKEVVIFS
jgi:hypothetical protein